MRDNYSKIDARDFGVSWKVGDIKCNNCGTLTNDDLIFGECFLCKPCYLIAVTNFSKELEKIGE